MLKELRLERPSRKVSEGYEETFSHYNLPLRTAARADKLFSGTAEPGNPTSNAGSRQLSGWACGFGTDELLLAVYGPVRNGELSAL